MTRGPAKSRQRLRGKAAVGLFSQQSLMDRQPINRVKFIVMGEIQIINSRHHRKNINSKSIPNRLAKFSILIVLLLGVLGSFSIISFTFYYTRELQNLPSHEFLPAIFSSHGRKIYEPTEVFDRRGNHLIAVLENPDGRNQEYLYIDESRSKILPESLILATIAAIEPNFWNNPGISWESLQNNNRPTIAQILINQFLIDEQTKPTRPGIQEILLGAQVIDYYGHEQILEWYLNSVYYGNLAYGADAASRVYFGKSATDLSLAESAVLVAAAISPQTNPINSAEASIAAKDQILTEMFNQGLINDDQLDEALEQKISTREAKDFPINLEPAYTNLVIEQVSQYIPVQQIFRGGLKIITTLDYELQEQVNCTVEFQLKRIDGEDGSNLENTSFDDCEMARLLPSYKQNGEEQGHKMVADVAVMDPIQGQLLAFLAGKSEKENLSRINPHPPGSILSPFIYLTSFARGSSPSTLVWDIPASIPPEVSDLEDEVGVFNGPVNIRTALANDYRTPAIQILSQMDPEQVWQLAARLGLTSLEVPPGNGSFRVLFEGGEALLTELVQAYGVLANQGVMTGIAHHNGALENANPPIQPQVVLQVYDEAGNVLLDCTDQLSDCRPIRRPVVTQELAYLITDILSDEVARWPSLGHPNSLEIGRQAAAKIGKSNEQAGVWTLGYTPELITGVWVGPEDRSVGINMHEQWVSGLWRAIIQYASREYPAVDFSVPVKISEVPVCNPSGMLPSTDCLQVVNEVFIQGNEPTQTDNLYKTYYINTESGRLATVYTSPALIEEKVFLLYPPEAESWAIEAGIPKIPEDYDILDVAGNQESEIMITVPQMFSTIKGTVPIFGRAAGDGFVSYRLQIGAGLNPDSWFQIGDEQDEPVLNGKLGTWDTTDLGGLYVLQLVVSYEDGSVSSSMVQVTVDNERPQLDIRFPRDGDQFEIQDMDAITILVNVNDNLGIDKIEFSIDGDIIASIESPPYAVPWKLSRGDHVIRVTAHDQAGNKNDSRVQITVK